jgi:uncharacterized protein
MDTLYSDTITTEAQIREVIGHPIERIRNKSVARLDEHCREFIARCPFLLIGSSDAQGNMDVSPKGDPPGFVHVLDDETIAIPDRPGNRRADTFLNLLQRPNIGLLFLIPGRTDTLRINGTAAIVRDRSLRERMAVKGKVPDLALVVKIKEVFFHCPKCMIRSGLWDQTRWPDTEGLASIARMTVERYRLDVSVEEMEATQAKGNRERLY